MSLTRTRLSVLFRADVIKLDVGSPLLCEGGVAFEELGLLEPFPGGFSKRSSKNSSVEPPIHQGCRQGSLSFES